MTPQTPLIPDQIIAQVGEETTWGTPVSATAKLMGLEKCEIEPIVDAAQVDEMRGSLHPAFLSNLTKIGAKGKVSGVVLAEDMVYWFDSLMGKATPSGAGPYTYAHTAPGTTLPTPRKQTLITGNGSNTYKGEGMLVTDLEISNKALEPWKFAANLIGEEYTSGSLAALSDRTVNPIMANMTTLTIDAFGGTIGTTAIATAWLEFRLKLNANRGVFPTIGSLKPAGYNEAKWKGCELYLKMIFDATTKAYVDAVLAGTSVIQKLVRIKGTKSASASVQLDFAGSLLAMPKVFSQDSGLVVVEMTLAAEYEGTFANIFKASTVNGLSVMP